MTIKSAMEIINQTAIDRLKAVLRDAKLQIEYLHDKFQETGSGNTVLARIEQAIAFVANMEIFMSEDFDQSSIPKKLIVELDDGWYFMDETWCYDGNGPFATAEEAHRQLNAYVVYLNTGEYPDTH